MGGDAHQSEDDPQISMIYPKYVTAVKKKLDAEYGELHKQTSERQEQDRESLERAASEAQT